MNTLYDNETKVTLFFKQKIVYKLGIETGIPDPPPNPSRWFNESMLLSNSRVEVFPSKGATVQTS